MKNQKINKLYGHKTCKNETKTEHRGKIPLFGKICLERQRNTKAKEKGENGNITKIKKEILYIRSEEWIGITRRN